FAAENASILDNTQLWNGNVDNGMVQCPEGSYFAQLYTNFTANPQNIPTKPISFVITLIR
ncbi:MAG: hypothetical protein RLZZ252_1949, partial [Bacteroidota bacterium]